MKKVIVLLAILSVSFVNAQAYIGANDNKFQLGINLQDNARGINTSYDFGLGDNISVGFSSSYALSVDEAINAKFKHRFDIKTRFNANLGNVVNIGEKFGIYPGLNFSLKNFGGHLGMRYFFNSGFGVFTELNAPLAKYKTGSLSSAEKLHNQFTVNLGASFSL